MKKILFIAVLSFMFLFASAADSFACSCRISPEPIKKQVKDAYTESSAVFSGEVLEITQKDEWTVAVRIKVGKSWKGGFSQEIIINTSKESSMCGYAFRVGKKYLVYAYGTKKDLSTTNCSRTTVFPGTQDIKFLDRLKKTKGRSA